MATTLARPAQPSISRGLRRPAENLVRNSTRRVEISTDEHTSSAYLDAGLKQDLQAKNVWIVCEYQVDEDHVPVAYSQLPSNQHHQAMKLSLGGLYPCPDVVQAVLKPVPGETKRIMDIGCGSRVWSIEMAKEFPHAEIIGLDVPQAKEHWSGDYPSNCTFEAIDFHFAMPEKYIGSCDLIHLRFIASAFSYFQKSMEEIEMCLKPGGLLILIDSTGEIMDQDQVSVLPMRSKPIPRGCQLQRLFYEVRHANSALGLDEFMMRATLQEGLWDHTQLDDCGAAELLLPIGPWVRCQNPSQERDLQRAGLLMRQSLQTVQRNHHIMLKNLGLGTNTSEEWQRITTAEIDDNNLRMLLDVRVLWGRRRVGDDLPAPPLLTTGQNTPIPATSGGTQVVPASLTSTPNAVSITFTSPYLHIYQTPRGWQRVTEKRQKIKGWMPDPVPFVYRNPNPKRRPSVASR